MNCKNITSEEKWIKELLVPMLVSEGKLTNDCKIEQRHLESVIKNISIENINSKETFMLTKCYKVQVTLNYNNDEYSHALIIKKTPKVAEESYNATNFKTLFSNEITAYTVTMPALGYSNSIPKYYYSHNTRLEAVIVLSDFSATGWQMSRSLVNLSLEHVLLAVNELGRFHGNAYGLKFSNSSQFQNIVQCFEEARFATEPPAAWSMVLNTSFQRLMKTVKASQLGVPKKFLDNMENALQNFHKFAREMVTPIEPYATICHGDFLRNNVAFKYDNQNSNTPTEIMLFDFQTLRYASPMIDLCLFMALSVGCDVRTIHFDKIFTCYWDALIQYTCEKGNIKFQDIPSFLRYESMIKEYVKYFAYGISIASSFLMILHDPLEALPEDFITESGSDVEIIYDVFNRGGETVNMELRSMVSELYEMSKKYEVEIFSTLH